MKYTCIYNWHFCQHMDRNFGMLWHPYPWHIYVVINSCVSQQAGH